VHALLGIQTQEALLSHPVCSGSWEGFVIENILSLAPQNSEAFFYRSSGGAECDLILKFPDQKTWAIEIKRSLSPKVKKGFHFACEDIKPDARYVVYPGTETYPLDHDIQAIQLDTLLALMQSMFKGLPA